MLKSSNLNSIIDDKGMAHNTASDIMTPNSNARSKCNGNGNYDNLSPSTPTNNNNNETSTANTVQQGQEDSSLIAMQLSAGLLQIVEPPLERARVHLKELIGKQNKIYIDLSKEKVKLDCSEVAKLHEMMNDVKFYKEKLIKIKKQMQNVYQRTKSLKKRAVNIENCKQREYQRKLDKQKQEESLIGRQQT